MNAKAAVSFQGKPYREWQDVDRCLKASLESNYKDLVERDHVKRAENRSCFAQSKAGSRIGPLGSGPRVRFADMDVPESDKS